jgi:hypothetical protein
MFWPQPPALGTSKLELILMNRIERAGLPTPVREYHFARPRRWRFDLCWPDDHVAMEVDGGGWVQGRHVRGKGFAADLEKYNTAALLGWIVLRVDGKMIEDGRAVAYLHQIFGGPGDGREGER